MAKKKKPKLTREQKLNRHIRDAMEYQDALMMGKTPKKDLIIHDALPSRELMIDGLKHLERLKPIGRFVLDNGTWLEGRAKVRDYPQAIDWRTKHQPQPNECFKNAREYCLAHPEARYFEGCFVISLTPIEHAWIVLEDGMVLDFTHEADIEKLKIEKGEVHITPPLYLGVEVPHDQLAPLHGSVGPNEPILELHKKSRRKRK